MPKQEMVVYEMVRDKKIPKILKSENENFAVCRGADETNSMNKIFMI